VQYIATLNDEAIGFCAVQQLAGWAGVKQITRLVVLPDYQGLGIGGRLITWTAQETYRRHGGRVMFIASQPALVHAVRKIPEWSLRHVGHKQATNSRRSGGIAGKERTDSTGRATFSFWYTPNRVLSSAA
jgi:GNAT superfamily N-acetyltransferase